jgi:hypothetical protein
VNPVFTSLGPLTSSKAVHSHPRSEAGTVLKTTQVNQCVMEVHGDRQEGAENNGDRFYSIAGVEFNVASVVVFSDRDPQIHAYCPQAMPQCKSAQIGTPLCLIFF